MQIESITVELSREPVEVSVLVQDQALSGPYIANRERRGIIISGMARQICLTADEALALKEWLQEQESALRALLREEAAALALVEQRQYEGVSGGSTGAPPDDTEDRFHELERGGI